MIATLLLFACGIGGRKAAESPPWAPHGTGTGDSEPPGGTSGDSPTDSASDDTGPPTEGCERACADTSNEAGWATCYSCRCKEAMDGWLPGPDELQCSKGAEIVIYRTDEAGVLSRVDAETSTCVNPSLLYQTCAPYGRLGQLTHGDITVKWICRRTSYNAEAATDSTIPYDDVAAILYNARNGASCWFDDRPLTGISGDNWPQVDLSASDADVAAWTSTFYTSDEYNTTDGSGCTGCHGNDPFNYSPYLQSVGWVTGSYTTGGYSRVQLDGSLALVESTHLVSPEAAACTSCHRIGSTSSCTSLGPDAMGLSKNIATQRELVAAMGDTSSPLWAINMWMLATDPFPDPETWEATYGLARDTILACCAHPGVESDTCKWEPHF